MFCVLSIVTSGADEGSVMVAVSLTVQPLSSVTVKVYVPAVKPKIELFVEPLLHE